MQGSVDATFIVIRVHAENCNVLKCRAQLKCHSRAPQEAKVAAQTRWGQSNASKGGELQIYVRFPLVSLPAILRLCSPTGAYPVIFCSLLSFDS